MTPVARWRAMHCAALLLLAAAPLWGQAQSVPELRDELARIRDATTLQAEGDLAGAERLLRDVVQQNPTSLSGLLILERLLATQGRVAELVPLVDELIQRDPASTIGHQLRARTFAALGRTDELERAGAAWIAATPRIETPYRELARLWLERHDFGRAQRLLERGRTQVGADGALALELGDVHAAAGDLERAVHEWGRAIGRQGQGFLLVQRRLRAQPDGGSAASPVLVQSLTRKPTSVARRRAAVQLALDAGLEGEAERIAPALLRDLTPTDREAFLADVARRADGAGLTRIGYWAYGELIASAEQDSERLLALRGRQAQLALAAGDTAAAAAAYQQLELATSPGSPQRRQAIAVRIRLGARDGDAAAAAAELRTYRAEYPEAPELDETAAAVGEALLQAGQLDAAEQAVLGVRGPRTALVRGRSFLRRGDVARASAELLLAAPALHGQEATRAIALAAALTRISASTGELLGSVLSQMRADPAGAIRELLERSPSLPIGERAPVLDFAAACADQAVLPDLAEQARLTLLSQAPRSDVAPAALFWLAQRASATEAERGEATVLLERLILEYPRSALVPQARRELDRISGRVPTPTSSKAGVS